MVEDDYPPVLAKFVEPVAPEVFPFRGLSATPQESLPFITLTSSPYVATNVTTSVSPVYPRHFSKSVGEMAVNNTTSSVPTNCRFYENISGVKLYGDSLESVAGILPYYALHGGASTWGLMVYGSDGTDMYSHSTSSGTTARARGWAKALEGVSPSVAFDLNVGGRATVKYAGFLNLYLPT